MQKEQEKNLRFAIKAGLGVIATLLTYQVLKDAVSGHTPSMAIVAIAAFYLNHKGKQERKVAAIGQKVHDTVVGASFIDSLRHHANNITAGIAASANDVDKFISALH